MIFYNLYYKNQKLNKRPTSENDVREILRAKYIRRKTIDNNYESIDTKLVKIIKCNIV